MENLQDFAWSPDSKTFVVNYQIDNDDSNSYVQASNVESLDSLWIANSSLTSKITFTFDGQFTTESNIFAPFFYWRSAKCGEVVRQGKLTNLRQIKSGDCNCGGGLFMNSSHRKTALIADFNKLIGLNTNWECRQLQNKQWRPKP